MKIFFFTLLLLYFLTSLTQAAVTYDATNSATDAGVNTISVTLTVGGGCTNTIIVGAVTWLDFNNGVYPISTFSIGGSGAVFVEGLSLQGGAINRRIEIWRQVGVSTGSNTVQADLPTTVNYVTLHASSYCGVNQTTPTDTPATADTITVDVPSAVDQVVVDAAMTASTATFLTADSPQNQRTTDTTFPANYMSGTSDKAGSVSTTTMSWTRDGEDYVGIVAVGLKPPTVTPTTRPHGPIIMQ